MPERIWIMEELNILHTMDAPIVVFTAGIMEDPHRSVTASLFLTWHRIHIRLIRYTTCHVQLAHFLQMAC